MKNLVRTAFCSTVLLLPATTHAVHALVPELSTTFYGSPAEDDGSYAAGTRAMDEHRWPDAVTAFDKVISQKGDRVDAALYWKAYSLNKLGKTPLAVATCDQLRSQFGASPWNKDCNAISVNVDAQVLAEEKIKSKMKGDPTYIRVAPYDRDRRDDRVTPGSDEDLKMLALNSLMHRDPATALPLLRGILTGNQSLSIKKHALFILAQNKSPEAESILRDVALGKLDPQLQSQAIQALAVFQGKNANDTLAEVYRTTTDPKIKKSIISAMFITKDAPRLVDMARNEKDLQLKRDIVSQLALMNDPAATNYMMELLK